MMNIMNRCTLSLAALAMGATMIFSIGSPHAAPCVQFEKNGWGTIPPAFEIQTIGDRKHVVTNPDCTAFWSHLVKTLHELRNQDEYGIYASSNRQRLEKEESLDMLDIATLLRIPYWIQSEELIHLAPEGDIAVLADRVAGRILPQALKETREMRSARGASTVITKEEKERKRNEIKAKLFEPLARQWILKVLLTPPLSSAEKVIYLHAKPGMLGEGPLHLNNLFPKDIVATDRKRAEESGVPSLRLFWWNEIHETSFSPQEEKHFRSISWANYPRSLFHGDEFRARWWDLWVKIGDKVFDLSNATRLSLFGLGYLSRPNLTPSPVAPLFWELYSEQPLIKDMRLTQDHWFSVNRRSNFNRTDIEPASLLVGGVGAGILKTAGTRAALIIGRWMTQIGIGGILGQETDKAYSRSRPEIDPGIGRKKHTPAWSLYARSYPEMNLLRIVYSDKPATPESSINTEVLVPLNSMKGAL
jgi:hypothetical protein